MPATIRNLLLVTLMAAVPPLRAQVLPPPSEMVLPPPRSEQPLDPASSPPTLGTPQAIPNPSPFLPSSPVYPESTDPIYHPRDPGQDGWGPYGPPSLPTAFFADVAVDILKPHLKAALSNSAFFPDGSQTTVRPPTTPVDWTAAPRFEFGWRAPNSLGQFAVWYRGFSTDGRQDAIALDGTPFALRTRLTLNEAAFDYGTVPYAFAPRWSIQARIGIAGADVFFDNQAVSHSRTLYASNNYYGGGPHGRLTLLRHIGLVPGLDLYGMADLIVMEGQIHQRFREDDLSPDGSIREGSFVQRKTQTVPIFTMQVGLSYVPPNLNRWRFTLGYEFEEWWFVGQIDMLDSRGQFYTNGVFLKAMVSF